MKVGGSQAEITEFISIDCLSLGVLKWHRTGSGPAGDESRPWMVITDRHRRGLILMAASLSFETNSSQSLLTPDL